MVSVWFLISLTFGVAVVYGTNAQIKLGPLHSKGKYGVLSKKSVLSAKDLLVSDNARTLLEVMKEDLIADPYKIALPKQVKIDDHETQGSVNFKNLELQGLSKLSVVDLKINLEERRLDAKINFQQLVLKAEVTAELTVDDAHQFLGGNLTATLNNVEIVETFTFSLTSDGKLKVVGFKIHVKSPDVEYNLKPLGLTQSDQSTIDASDTTKLIAHKLAKASGDPIAETVVEELNKILSKYTENQIISSLLPGLDK